MKFPIKIFFSKCDQIRRFNFLCSVKRVYYLLCLGSWADSCTKDFYDKTSRAWTTMRKMDVIWKSNLPLNSKLAFPRTTETTVFCFFCIMNSKRTLNILSIKRLNGTYTNMLEVGKNMSCDSILRMLYYMANSLR